jgi:hypothetical protein
MNPQLVQSALLAVTAISSSLTQWFSSVANMLLEMLCYMYMVDTNGNRVQYDKLANWVAQNHWIKSGEICTTPVVPYGKIWGNWFSWVAFVTVTRTNGHSTELAVNIKMFVWRWGRTREALNALLHTTSDVWSDPKQHDE